MQEIMNAVKPKPVSEKNLGIIAEGTTGSGKSTLIGTAPMPLIFDFDHGLTTLDSMGLQEGIDYYKISFYKHNYKTIKKPEKNTEGKMIQVEKKIEIPAENIDKLMQILAYAADKSGPFAPDGPFGKVETIALDGFTAMSDYFLYEIMVKNLGLNYIIDKGGYDGYGQLKKVFGDVAEKMIRCKENYHIIITCLTKTKQRPGSNRVGDDVFVPDIDGSFNLSIGRVLDEFYYLNPEIKGTALKYMVYTAPTNTVIGLKSRSKMPSVMEGVTFSEIHKTLLETFEKNKKKS